MDTTNRTGHVATLNTVTFAFIPALLFEMDVTIPDHTEALKRNHSKNDLVARWVVPVRGKLFDIELEHGTISGKRVIWVNGEEVLRRDMMYRLVGEDTFFLDEDKRCIIHVRMFEVLIKI